MVRDEAYDAFDDADPDDSDSDDGDYGDNVVLFKEGKDRRRGRSVGENNAWTTRWRSTSL